MALLESRRDQAAVLREKLIRELPLNDYRSARQAIKGQQPIYMPDRFKLTHGDGRTMTFDSDFRATSMNGRRLTDREQADIAAQIARQQDLTALRPRNRR